MDEKVAAYARTFLQDAGVGSKVEVLTADALSLQLSVTANVCVCEMIDAGLLCEKQIDVVNFAHESLLGPEARIIPRKIALSILKGDVANPSS